MARYRLAAPPVVKQPTIGDDDNPVALPVCWACALSSWLKIARADDWSIQQLANYFQAYCNGMSLNLAYFDSLANTAFVSMEYQLVTRSDLTFDYLYEKLMSPYGGTGGHLYMILLSGKPMVHAVVGYGLVLAEPVDGIAVMDPLRGVLGVYTLEEFRMRANNFIVGWPRR